MVLEAGVAFAVVDRGPVDRAAMQQGLQAVELLPRQVGLAVDDDAADLLALARAAAALLAVVERETLGLILFISLRLQG